MGDDKARPIVLDNASKTFKAGFAGDNSPCGMFPTIVGREVSNHLSGNPYFGDEAKTSGLSAQRLIVSGFINSWSDMEGFWKHTFDKVLQVDPKMHPVLLTEPPLNRKVDRERVTQIMFEKFEVPGMYLANQAVLSLFSAGLTTGTVLDIGATGGHVVPIHNSHCLSNQTTRLKVGGDDITNDLVKNLSMQGSLQRRLVEQIKEKICYVAPDFDAELRSPKKPAGLDATYELPHGIIIGNEAFRCPEALFKPELIGLASEGCHLNIVKSITQCEADIRKDLCNIVLAGGGSMFVGLDSRLQKEVDALTPADMKVKVMSPPDRAYSSWIGGSILASLPNFINSWIFKQEYDETGPAIVHRKC